MLENLSDRALLETKDGQAGFQILYNRYWEALYKKAFYRFGNSADAQDAVQEIFISLWRNRQTIQVDETLSPYLFTALKYYIIKQVYQKAKKRIEVPLSAEKLEYSEFTTQEMLQYKELRSAVDGEVDELPKRMKEVYRLRRVENLQIAEIALRLNLSEQTVKNTLTNALRRLRERLSRYSFLFYFFAFFIN